MLVEISSRCSTASGLKLISMGNSLPSRSQLEAGAHRARFGRARETRAKSIVFGHPPNPEFRRVLDREGALHDVPAHGILLDKTLAGLLGCARGDVIELEWLEGQRVRRRVHVSGFVDEAMGLFGHMQVDALESLGGEESLRSMALLEIDPKSRDALLRALEARPEVFSVSRREAMIELFRKQTGGQMRFTTLILTVFAVIIASGVVYNNARIALSTRSRDLASLRVLGFRRREISSILLGELAVHVLVAIAPGLWLGRWLVDEMMSAADPELYRFPLVISAQTYAFAIAVVLTSALASALIVRARLDRLDLIGVLKSKE